MNGPTLFRRTAFIACVAGWLACGAPPEGAPVPEQTGTTSDEIRSMTNAEALADFDQIASAFRGLYGAMERKQQRYKFNFETMASQYRTRVRKATTEAEYQGIFQEFVARFQDAHVTLTVPFTSDDARSYSLPLQVLPVENTFVVYLVAQSLASTIPVGEELLSIDGIPAQSIAQGLLKYVGMPNPLSAMHMAASNITFRPSYMAEGLSPNKPAKLLFRRVDGSTHEETLSWRQGATFIAPAPTPVPAPPQAGQSSPENLIAASAVAASVTRAELSKFGARVPFFMSPQVKTALGITGEVTPSEASLKKFDLTKETAAAASYFAVKYTVNNKKILLVRIHDYQPADADAALNYLRALIDEQQSQVDGLVLDQTHNPGGSLPFAAGVVSLLTNKPFNGIVQQMHGDRLWINNFGSTATRVRTLTGDANHPFALLFDERARLVDEAYSQNKSLSAPIPFFFEKPVFDPDTVQWTKPVVVLADELSVSCADFVPLLVKANKIATVFGQRTMGGGGNVEEVARLNNSQGTLSISRGLGTVHDPSGKFPEENFIEDNGILPDVAYSHTLADFRAGYIAYVNAFNNALLKKIP